jgi:hypothetical protein
MNETDRILDKLDRIARMTLAECCFARQASRRCAEGNVL